MTEMTTYNSSNTPSKEETDLISRFIQEILISFRAYFQDCQKNSSDYLNKNIKRNVYIDKNKKLDDEIKHQLVTRYTLIFSHPPKDINALFNNLLNCFDEYLRDELKTENMVGNNLEEVKASQMKEANEKLKKNISTIIMEQQQQKARTSPTIFQRETFYSLAKLYLEKSINHKSFWNILNENGLYDLFTIEFEIICNAPEKMNDEFRNILIKYNLEHLFDNNIIDLNPKLVDDYIAGNISIKECIYRLNMFSLDKEQIEALEELKLSYEERKIIGEKLKKFQDVLYELDNNKFSELVDKYQKEIYNLINKLINKEPLKKQEPSPIFPLFLLGAGIFTAIATKQSTKQISPRHHLKE